MNWYYALGGQQQGPVEDAQFDTLIAAGTITPDTLVWREGMPNWLPLREARPTASAPGVPPVVGLPPIVRAGAPGANEIVCAECGKIFTRDNAIQYGTSWVCATCKPAFVQKLKEGAATGGGAYGGYSAQFDPDAYLTELKARGYTLDIAACLRRGWEVSRANLWKCIGGVVVIYGCLFAASAVPLIGGLIQVVIQGPLLGGLMYFFLKMLREQETSIADAFSGFGSNFLQLFLVSLVSGLLAAACFIPMAIVIVVGIFMAGKFGIFIIIPAALICAVPAIYLNFAWMFAIPLVIDKKIDFWPAMELSRKAVTMHWWIVFLFFVACGLLVGIVAAVMVGVGVLAGLNKMWVVVGVCGLGVVAWMLFITPTMFAAWMKAYEDIFSPSRAPLAA